MPRILASTVHTRRRFVQVGVVSAVLAIAGPGGATARQDAGSALTFIAAGLDVREGFDERNSDVLMVAGVNPEIGTVRIVSIPRDLYVEIPGFGMDKITRAFHHGFYGAGESWDGGAELLADTVGHNFGLAIDGVATTTFDGFAQVIDALGGVEVDNPYEVVDPVFEVEEPGLWLWPAGVQTLDGESALRFVRTRNMDGDDGRVMRQQLVLAALLDRVRQPGVVTALPGLVAAVRDAVQTNIPPDVQLSLIALAPSLRREDIAFLTIADQLAGGTLDNGMWVYQADWNTLPRVVEAFLAGS